MVIDGSARTFDQIALKIEQGLIKNVHHSELPDGALPIESLKSLEAQLVARGLVKSSATPVYPLWFLAEMERNVFLWRHGLSLADAPRFEFWVDVGRLVEKRRTQLSLAEPSNPFLSTTWGEDTGSTPDGAGQSSELRYLNEFVARLQSIQKYAHALSVAATSVLSELPNAGSRAVTVVLPAFSNHSSNRQK